MHDVIDNLFSYEGAKPAYIKFREFEASDGDETSVLSVIRFCTVIFDEVDNRKQPIEWMPTNGQN